MILVLGGTAEARSLADALVARPEPFVSSLAGRVASPALPVGQVRSGGFGGVAGLTDYLRSHQVRAVVDATHPFASGISTNAAAACTRARVPLLRLERPSWRDHRRASEWSWVASAFDVLEIAATARRPFLTTGRQSLGSFLPWRAREVLARVVEPPADPVPPTWRLLLSRGPYRYESERDLMSEHAVDTLVTKDSGGEHTVAKLDAAADLGIPIVVVARPPLPTGTNSVRSIVEVLDWLDR